MIVLGVGEAEESLFQNWLLEIPKSNRKARKSTGAAGHRLSQLDDLHQNHSGSGKEYMRCPQIILAEITDPTDSSGEQ
jgi:hypothetical protein